MGGERGDVNSETTDEWKSRLTMTCDGYEPCDIFNMDETGIFFKSGGKTTYCAKNIQCAGGKRSKDRVTNALYASMTGGKKWFLWCLVKVRNQHALVELKKRIVTYRFNKKAWMFEEWLWNVDKKI